MAAPNRPDAVVSIRGAGEVDAKQSDGEPNVPDALPESEEESFRNMFRVMKKPTNSEFRATQHKDGKPFGRTVTRKTFFGLLSTDQKEKLTAFAGFAVEMYKIVMATLLSVFVPQLCPPAPPKFTAEHTCTVEENFVDLTGFNKFVLAWNFITLGAYLLTYYFVWQREKFIIEYLDEDKQLPDTNLPRVITRFPIIESGLFAHNRTVFGMATATMILLIINAISSAVLVFRDYYDGFRTVTVFITNLLLIIMVIQRTLQYAWIGLQEKHALSCINIQPLAYNAIDKHHKNMEVKHRDTDAK